MTAAPLARRLSALVLVGVGATTISACGMPARQSGAAVVDGAVVTNDDVDRVVSDLKTATGGDAPRTNIVLTLLILSPFVEEEAKAKNKWTQEGPYQQFIPRIPNASDSTKHVLTTLSILANEGPNRMTSADLREMSDKVLKADIQVNPRYGALQRTGEVGAPIIVGADKPAWIKSTGGDNALLDGSQDPGSQGSGGQGAGDQGSGGQSPQDPQAPQAPAAP